MELFKDRYKLGLLAATFFLLGIIISAYQVYRLPHNLMLADGYHSAFFPVYLTLAVTFLIGALTVWSTLNYRNEVIVYRDKQLDKNSAGKDNNEDSHSTISLDNIKDSLRQAQTEKEAVQAGLHAICKLLDAGQGAVYLVKEYDGQRKLQMTNGYALSIGESKTITYEIGEGLVGQAAVIGKTLYVDDVPDGYVKIISGLGSASPRYLLIVALKHQDKVTGVMEIASFTPLNDNQRKFVEESAQLIADKISSTNP
jgi:putative methionine-R-sulfoxide reductase with GAF domain